MLEKIVSTINNSIDNSIDNSIENSKKEIYVCYCSGFTGYSKQYFTKKELIKFINEHQLSEMDIYRVKDKIKIERELRIIGG